jgi:hypothetical protein
MMSGLCLLSTLPVLPRFHQFYIVLLHVVQIAVALLARLPTVSSTNLTACFYDLLGTILAAE